MHGANMKITIVDNFLIHHEHPKHLISMRLHTPL
jgi:hypothetical protein